MKKVLLFALLTFIYNSTNAQELISSSSGYAEKDGKKVFFVRCFHSFDEFYNFTHHSIVV